jgi:glycosyltransferase involved in cell wall biosynthesis
MQPSLNTIPQHDPGEGRASVKSLSLTVVILTKNEEARLPLCLTAIPSRYPIVVVDSGSDDGTVSIAEKHGCVVYTNPWRGFAPQRNYALERCGILAPWVLFIDADEVFPPAFFSWFESSVETFSGVDAVMVPSILYLRERPLKFAPGYPIYHPRMVRRERVRFVVNHAGHGESIPEDCNIIYAEIPYEHHFCDSGLIRWMHKHINIAGQEVYLKPTKGAMMTKRGRMSVYFGRSILRIPARFLYHFLVRGGFLDGKAGFEYALMFAWYEATIYIQALTGVPARDCNLKV